MLDGCRDRTLQQRDLRYLQYARLMGSMELNLNRVLTCSYDEYVKMLHLACHAAVPEEAKKIEQVQMIR